VNIAITPEKLKEIAQELDMGMICYYHIVTGELESIPDELKGHAGYEEQFWRESNRKVKTKRKQYICFEAMDGSESFNVMETFVLRMEDEATRRRFEDAIAFKKPFQNFKQLLYQYPELQQQWYLFKEEQYIQWVQQQLEAYNLANDY
jgi:hypothetical protein